MKALRQLGFLRLLPRPEAPPDETQRVLALFRNRAELKKAYGGLQEEIYRLQERIKQQEGATERIQEMLGVLEKRLGAAETAYPALVFYQLRRLWQSGRELLEQFVADLVRQQDERERRQHLADHNRRQFTHRHATQELLRAAELVAAQSAARIASLEGERMRLKRVWHYFKRRALEQQIAVALTTSVDSNAALARARSAAQAIEAEPVPAFPGLSIESRRAINLAAIAYAEVLCLRLANTPLVQLAREATNRREVGDDYGSQQNCEGVMRQIESARVLLLARSNVAQEITARTERLRQDARYRQASDTVPTEESVARSAAADVHQSNGAAAAFNALAQDVWDVYRVVLR